MISTAENLFRYDLKADCNKCFGLCCVALYFSTSDGFPVDKTAGKPCINLSSDFTCNVHKDLRNKGLKGCTSYDCFGAGQKVAQSTFKGTDWIQHPKSSKQMFEVFLVMRQLHEILWYIAQALTLETDSDTLRELDIFLNNTINLTLQDAEALLQLDLATYRGKASILLQDISGQVRNNAYPQSKNTKTRRIDYFGADLRKVDLKGKDLRGACLIAANLMGVDLSWTDLLGADMRDCNLNGANLASSIFLTQSQINSAKGNSATKLPPTLSRPDHWK